jgi:hypothetical protein
MLWSGKKVNGMWFCNDLCVQEGIHLTVADKVPDTMVEEYAQEVHSGACPLCNQPGTIDVHTSHKIWSLLTVSSLSRKSIICCNGCGFKKKAGDIAFCLVFGWWSMTGILLTPFQVFRNLLEFFNLPHPDYPSDHLKQMLRGELAKAMLKAQSETSS